MATTREIAEKYTSCGRDRCDIDVLTLALREFGEELAKIVDEHTRGSLELAKIADDAGAKQDATQHRMDSHISKSCAAAIRAAIRESL